MRFLRRLDLRRHETRSVLRVAIAVAATALQTTFFFLADLSISTFVGLLIAGPCILLIDRFPRLIVFALVAGTTITPYLFSAAPFETAAFLSLTLLIPARRFRQVGLILAASCIDVALRAQSGGEGAYSIVQAPVLLSGSASVGMTLLYFRAQMERMEAARDDGAGAGAASRPRLVRFPP